MISQQQLTRLQRLVSLGLLASCAAGCEGRPVKLYQRIEEVVTNDAQFDNPFTDTELRLEVTAPVDRPLGSSFTWYGFYDGDGAGSQGGHTWKFRLLADRSGRWTVRAGFYVPGTQKPNGPPHTFSYDVSNVKAAGQHGHVRVDPNNSCRLRCDDGTPWVPFVMHSSGLLCRDHAIAQQWIDEFARRGIDALSVRFHSEPSGSDPGRYYFLAKNNKPISSWPAGGADDFDYMRFDLATWHFSEETMAHAEAKDVKLSIWFGVSGMNRQYNSYGPMDNPDDATLGPKQKLFIRYFLARWAPYALWWHWTIDSEYEETGKGCLRRLRTWAAALQAQNPWKIMLTTHVLHDWTPGDAPELDLATIQRRVTDSDEGVTDCREFITSNLDHHRPVYNAEGVWRLGNVTHSRVATWAHLMAGGFSNIAHTGGRHSDPLASSWAVTWDYFTPRGKEDAVEIGKMSRFFNRTPGIDISHCSPHDELVRIETGHLAMCLAEPGESYYVWLDRGGTASLDLSPTSGTFSVIRYACTDLEHPISLASLTGRQKVTLGPTPDGGFGHDYLFVLKRSGPQTTSKLNTQDDANLVQHLAPLLCDDLPELARFRQSVAGGDAKAMNEAADALVAFFNQRWPAEQSKSAPSDKSRRATAEVMEHTFRYGALSHQFGEHIDWDYPLDYEWRVSLNRLGFLTSMASVARYDHEDKIAAEVQNLLCSWIQDCPLPAKQGGRYISWQKWPEQELAVNWRSLDAAIRVQSLRLVYSLLTNSPVVTRRTRLQLINSIWQHIDYLKDDDWDGGNWLSLATNAVSTAGIEWTMFRDARQWREAAKEKIGTNVLRDIYPDGKEIEDSTGYIQFATSHMIQSYLRLKNGGVTFSDEVVDRLRRCLDFSAWVAFPDGQSPMIGDSDASSAYVPVRYWRTLDRPDVGYVVTAGKEGTLPRESSRAWPDGGWYVMRSPWASRPFDQDLHLVFKASPGNGHGHLDQLSLTAYAYGRPLLIDPGRLNYRKDGAREFACTEAHNTIVVDHASQRRGRARVSKWITNSTYDLVDASHELYTGVVHRRRVLFVKDAFWLVIDSMAADATHLYDQSWHFPEGMEIKQENERVIARYADGRGIMVIPLVEGRKGERFNYNIAYIWDRRTPATGWRWEAKGGSIEFATLLIPNPAGAILPAKVLSSRVDKDAVQCTVQIGTRPWELRLTANDEVQCNPK